MIINKLVTVQLSHTVCSPMSFILSTAANSPTVIPVTSTKMSPVILPKTVNAASSPMVRNPSVK